MRFFGLLIILFAFSVTSFSQTGKVEGKVTDSKSGAKLSGVSVTVEGGNAKALTSTDGYFQMTLEAGKTYTINLSSVGYSAKAVSDVEVKANEVTNLDIILDIAAKTEEAVVIRSSRKKETVAAMIAYQKNATVVAEVVSAEAIRRSPDKNTGEVLKRIPGLSLVNGKYIVVRGLADRYNQVMINGFLMSSTEPDRKTFTFNIIPSALIDNIIVNKTFIPELPGEWAGGLIQMNTKDVPAKSFLYIQVGPGLNTETVGNDFYQYQGAKTDFLGFDSHVRSLPETVPLKADFAALNNGDKTAYGKDFKNIWTLNPTSSNILPLMDQNFLLTGGFNKSLGGNNRLGAVFSVNYIRNNRKINIQNQVNLFENNTASLNFSYDNQKYAQDVLGSVLANFTFQLGSNNKITFKNMLNVNTTNYSTIRTGKDFDFDPINGTNIQAYELAYKATTYYNLQLAGDHNIVKPGLKFHWFGSFNLLDQYIPDQRRVQYNQDDNNDPSSPYSLLIGASKSSQKSGSRYFGTTNDYVYTAGGDLGKTLRWHDLNQTIKGGYFFQVKDRLFDARPFAIYLPSDNPTLRHLPVGEVFAPENFGTGFDDQLAFNELSGSSYRYLANSILNAGYLQLDNQLSDKFRAVWGVRVENFDQVVGSTKQWDPRFVHSTVTDWLPGVNLTYKVNNNTNVRLAGSQTVIRPEFRELSTFQFYDFDLGATVAGNPSLVRTKVTNIDLRYELYPASGELFTFGVFYKYFKDPIEAFFNISSGSASTYNFVNADEATSFGAELDFRKRLDFVDALKHFTFQGNLSYIYNRVSNADNTIDRPMQGQSPYLINAGLQYDLDESGFNTTLLFNQIGRRIIFVGGSDQPPIWENPRGVLDFQIAKKIIKGKGVIRLNISDIFNQQEVFYNDTNDNKKYDPDTDSYAVKRKLGTNFSLAFGYNF